MKKHQRPCKNTSILSANSELKSVAYLTLHERKNQQKKYVCVELPMVVPFHSAVFDLAHATPLSPATGFPAAGTILHGRA